jgi:WD40 repeat protein
MAMSDYTIRLIDWQTKKEKNRILTPKVDPQKYAGGAITCLTFNHDGTRLASCTDTVYLNQVTRKIDIWDTATCKAAQTLDGPQYPIMEIAFTPKGDKLAISARQNYFNLFDLKSGEKLKEWERPGRADLLTALYRDGVTPDQMPKGPPLLTRLWNLGSGEDILQGKLPNELQSLTLSPDNRTVVVGDIKGTIRLYDLATGNDIRQFSDKQKSPVHGLTYLEGGKLLCAQEWSGYLRLWDPDTGTQPKMKLWATPYGKRSLAVSSDGKLAAIVESGPDVTLWKSLKEQKPVNIRLPQGVRRIEFTPDGKKLLCGSWEGVVQVIDVTNNTVLKPIGREHIVMFAVSPDGNTVATWRRTEKYEWDKHLTLWDIDTGAERARINVGPTAFTGMTFTPDGRGLWLPHSAGWAQFEVATGEQRAWVQGHWPISVSKNGRLFVCKAENAIFVWDVTGRNNGGVLDATPLKEEELVKAWTALGGNAYQAYAAIYRLAGVPGQALPFLEKQLKLVTPLDPKRVEKLLIQLNSKVTVEREQAFAELPKYGQWALREVKAALEKKQGPEMRGRLEDLVPLIRDYPAFAEQTQAMRIIELLEQIGTADARRLLETLADGERPQFTEAARAALRRLGKE